MSVHFDDDARGMLTISYNSDKSNDNDMDVDNELDGCNCGENQLSHHNYDGNVCSDLPEHCWRTVNGLIGSAAEATGGITSDQSSLW